MGDVRFARRYQEIRDAADSAEAIRRLPDEAVVEALAYAASVPDALLANVLATEAANRMRRARAMVDHLPVGVYVTDVDGRIREANPAATRLLGYEPGALVGRDADALLHPGDAPVAEVLRYPRVLVRDDDLVLRADGGVVHVALVAAPVLRMGEVDGAVVAFHDVTERLRAEEALEFQRALLEAQLEASGDAILVVDDEGHTLLRNRRFERLWPLPGEALRDDDEALRAALATVADPDAFFAGVRALYGGDVECVWDELSMKDGRAVERYGAPVVDGTGRRRGWIWTFRDITVRKLTEEELRRREEEWRRFVDVSPEPVVVHADGRLLYANAAAARVLGAASAGEVVGEGVIRFVHPDSLAVVRERMRAVATERRTLPPLREHLLRLDGSDFWAEVAAVPVTYAGRPAVQLALRDVTHEVQAAAERARTEREIEDLAALASGLLDVAAGASPDVREKVERLAASCARLARRAPARAPDDVKYA